jgi:hypothetical protein
MFDIGQKEQSARASARWMEYVSDGGTVVVHFKVKPRDPEVVKDLNTQCPQPERVTRAGRVLDPRTEDQAQKWNRGYVVGHLEDWDVTVDGAKAPIDDATVTCLTERMRGWIMEQTRVDDPREYEVACPFPGSSAGSSGTSITQS